MAPSRSRAAQGIPAAVSRPAEVFALPEVFGLVEKADLPALAVALQFPDLFDEVAILQRLAYKNNNQHRASKHHQAVCQVLRVLRLFQQLQLPALIQALHAAAQRTALPEAPAAATSKRARRQQQQPRTAAAGQRQAVQLPSFQAGCFAARRLLSGVQLLLELHCTILAAAQHLSGQLSRGYFMPFCLVAAAAAARIRLLATSALLELLQAYNSIVQLLPLLPAEGPVSNNPSTINSRSSVDSRADSAGLPQMLQLAWNGPLPALRSIPFEPEGPQSLQGLAAELQQTYCISTSLAGQAGSAAGGAEQGAARRPAAGGSGAAGLVASGVGGGGDVGVAISREAFAQQLGQQQQQQEEEDGATQRPQRQAKQRALQQPARQRRQQQQSTPAIAVCVFEDKQPQRGPAVGALPQEAAQQAPLYTTVPGLGFSLGGLHQPGPDVSNLLGHTAAAAAAAAAGAVGPADAAGGGQAAQPMDVDPSAAEDQEEFQLLYGGQPPPLQPQRRQQQQQQQQEPLQQQQQQQPQQLPGQRAEQVQQAVTQHTSAAQPAAAPRKGLQAAAAFLAMQGAHSSDDDDCDMAGPFAPASAATAVASMPAPTAAAALQGLQQPAPQGGAQSQPFPQGMAPLQGQAGVSSLPVQHTASAGASEDAAAAAAGPPQPSGGQAAGAAGVPLLQASKKGRQKKKAKPAAAKDAEGSGQPRDSILDMLLQGL